MKRKPRSSIEVFDERLRNVLEGLGINSPNYTLPAPPKRMVHSDHYFRVLEQILSEKLRLQEEKDDETFV